MSGLDNLAAMAYNVGIKHPKGAGIVKRWIAILLAALLLCTWAVAEEAVEEAVEEEEDFGFEFADDGYDGEWITLQEQGFEFCLPDGWAEAEAKEGALYAAAAGDGSATLSIRDVARDVEDLVAWGEMNLDRYDLDEANFYYALVVEEDESLAVYFLLDEERLMAFDFTRANAEALPRAFALQIVGSACLTWDDDDFPFTEEDAEELDGDVDDDDAFEEAEDEEDAEEDLEDDYDEDLDDDFGEEFEADLG